MQSNTQSDYFLVGLFILLVSTVGVIYYFQSNHNTSTPADKVVNGKSNRTDKLSEVGIKGVPLPFDSFGLVFPPGVAQKRRSIIDSFPKTRDVTFPSGEIVPVTYRLRDRDYLPLRSSADIGDYINQLTLLVEEKGNGAAALEIFSELNICSRAPRSPEEYYLRINKLPERGNYPTKNALEDTEQVASNLDNYENIVTSLRAQYHSCKNVSEQLINGRKVWLDRAVELNSYDALHSNTIYYRSSGSVELYELLKQKWNAGHIDTALSFKYFPNPSARERDPWRALAYSLAYKRVSDAYVKQSEPATNEYYQALAHYGYISHSEYEAAEQLAITLIRNNKNCCIGPWLFIESRHELSEF